MPKEQVLSNSSEEVYVIVKEMNQRNGYLFHTTKQQTVNSTWNFSTVGHWDTYILCND